MIHLIATGGTIAGEADPESGGARYRAGVRPVGALLAAVPDLDAFDLSAEQVLSLDSKDMTPDGWLTILAAVRRALGDPATDGVVILHGTDTLEETAYFLQLTVPGGKPVVLTGAMRPADHPQADGPANPAVPLLAELLATDPALYSLYVGRQNGDFLQVIAARNDRGVLDAHKAPSGTALMLADAVSEALPYDAEYVYDRHERREKRPAHEIGISAIRGGTIVGEHSVLFCGRDEIIEIKHTALSREVFAVGAVDAAAFMAERTQPGMYDMSDVIASHK